jgi:hypothetical protein
LKEWDQALLDYLKHPAWQAASLCLGGSAPLGRRILPRSTRAAGTRKCLPQRGILNWCPNSLILEQSHGSIPVQSVPSSLLEQAHEGQINQLTHRTISQDNSTPGRTRATSFGHAPFGEQHVYQQNSRTLWEHRFSQGVKMCLTL